MQVMDSKKIDVFSQEISIENQDKNTEKQEISAEIQAVETVDRSPFRAPLCEFCRSETKVYSVQHGARYCKCKRCGWTFKK